MKRLISILLSLMLIMTSLPMIASADGAAETQTASIVATDTLQLVYADNTARDVSVDGSNYILAHDTAKQVDYLVYRFNLPMGAVGVEIDSATLTYWTETDWNDTDSFFRVPYGTWTSMNDVPQDYFTAVKSADDSDNYVGTCTISNNNTRKQTENEVDVTAAVQAAVADGEAKVALSFNWSTSWYANARRFYSQNASGMEPTLSVSYRVTGVPAMMFQSVSVNNGDTIGVNDGISFTYSNPVDPASVTPADFVVKNFADEAIAISDSDIVVSGNTVTLKKTWDSYSAYTVSLSGIADVTGQTVSESSSVSFKTSINTANIESNEIMIKDSQWWTYDHLGSGAKYYEGAAQNKTNGYTFPRGADVKQNGYAVYRFELPQISEGKVLSSAVLSYWYKYDYVVTDKWFAVPFGTWTEPSGKDWNNEYVAAVESAASNPDYVGTYSSNSTSNRIDNAVVDVTGAISKTLAAGESGVALTFHGGDSQGNTYNRFLYHELNAGYEPTLIINTVPAEIAAVSSTPEKGGKMTDMNSPVEMVLATTIEDGYATSDYVKLINNVTGLAVDAQVDYDKTTGKLTVTPESDLVQRTMYKVVLKAGIQDVYGTTLSADKTITAFTTGVSLEYSAIKFTSEETPLYDSCAVIDSYTAGSSVTAVARIANSTSKDYDAVMIIALYDENDELIDLDVYGGVSAVPAHDEVQFSKAITVPTDVSDTTIKAFIWDGFDYIRPMLEHNSINQAQ